MGQAAVVDVEVGIENGFALGPDKRGLGLDPQARFLLFGVGQQPSIQVANHVGVLVGDISRFAGIRSQIKQFGLPGSKAILTSFQSPLRIAPRNASTLISTSSVGDGLPWARVGHISLRSIG